MRGWCFILCLSVLSAQDYVCDQANLRRMVATVQTQAEAHYSKVVTSCSKLAATLAYSSAHPDEFHGVYQVSDLTPCNNTPDQFSLAKPNSLIGIQILNRTAQGVNFTFEKVEEELAFITSVANFLPAMLAQNPDAITLYFAGTSLNCSSFYFYPWRDVCGVIPMGDICSFYHQRYNLFMEIDDLQADLNQGGHWSDTYTDKFGNLVIAYSLPVTDSQGNFRAQLGLSVGTMAVGNLIESSKPSQNGYTFMVNEQGDIIYAPQAVIDILFGADANLTLRAITSAYTNGTKNPGISLRQSKTEFAALPGVLSSQNSNGSAFFSTTGYYVAWSRFTETLKTWFLVGLTPKNDLDGAAIWSVSPALLQVTLTDDDPSVDVTIYATNNGLLPFSFYVGANAHSRGILMNASSIKSEVLLLPNSTQALNFTVRMGTPSVGGSFTSRFVIPFYASSSGYGPCFKPVMSELLVHVVRQSYYIPSHTNWIVVTFLCSITACVILAALLTLFCFRYSPPILALAPRLCALKLLGLLFVLGAASVNMITPSTISCEWTHRLFHFGFTLTGATIAAKNYRNRRIFSSKKLQAVALSDFKLMAFVAVCLLIDCVILLSAALAEPYSLTMNGACEVTGWVAYSLLCVTKILIWAAAAWNTLRIANVPPAFADGRLNGVLIVIAILAAIWMVLQFTNALPDVEGTQILLGSLFMWVSVCLVVTHFVLKLSFGYVTVADLRSSTKDASVSSSAFAQPKLEIRLQALLLELEAQSIRLASDKKSAGKNVKINQKLMFEVRAEILALTIQGKVADSELYNRLPPTVKSALETSGSVRGRRTTGSPPKPRSCNGDEAEGLPEQHSLLASESPKNCPMSANCNIVVSGLPQQQKIV